MIRHWWVLFLSFCVFRGVCRSCSPFGEPRTPSLGLHISSPLPLPFLSVFPCINGQPHLISSTNAYMRFSLNFSFGLTQTYLRPSLILYMDEEHIFHSIVTDVTEYLSHWNRSVSTSQPCSLLMNLLYFSVSLRWVWRNTARGLNASTPGHPTQIEAVQKRTT